REAGLPVFDLAARDASGLLQGPGAFIRAAVPLEDGESTVREEMADQPFRVFHRQRRGIQQERPALVGNNLQLRASTPAYAGRVVALGRVMLKSGVIPRLPI